MTSSVQPFIDVTGFPAQGEYVPPTPRAAEHLIAGGWTPPVEGSSSGSQNLGDGRYRLSSQSRSAVTGRFDRPRVEP